MLPPTPPTGEPLQASDHHPEGRHVQPPAGHPRVHVRRRGERVAGAAARFPAHRRPAQGQGPGRDAVADEAGGLIGCGVVEPHPVQPTTATHPLRNTHRRPPSNQPNRTSSPESRRTTSPSVAWVAISHLCIFAAAADATGRKPGGKQNQYVYSVLCGFRMKASPTPNTNFN